MPPDGIDLTPPDKLLTLEDNKRLINIFTNLGVNKIRFTGGEPTISKQLIPLISYSKSVSNVNMIGKQPKRICI
jgi:cyclic pyranopterin phosphate synthase